MSKTSELDTGMIHAAPNLRNNLMKVIQRNQRQKALAILDNAKDIRSYTLDNRFMGNLCDPLDDKGEKWLIKEWIRHAFAKLGQMGDNRFTLEINSNRWYEFTN